MQNIDIRQLRYFLAVANERSFTRAAEQLHMTQPPLSQRIQELEVSLGLTLFERGTRPLKLTEAGKLLYERASMVMRGMQQLQVSMQNLAARKSPRFVFGLVPSTLYARLPEVIRQFREIVPQVEIGVTEMGTEEQMAALKDRRIDIGFDRIVVEDPGIRHVLARNEPLVVAVAKDHPLALQGAPVELARLCREPLIFYPSEPRPSFADLVLSAFVSHGLMPDQIQEVRELQTGLVMVAAGVGACIVPQSVRHHGRGDVAFIDIAEPISAPLLMRFRQGDTAPELRQLLTLLARLYEQWGWPIPTELARMRAASDAAVSGHVP
ncbi:LysR family transcriptional regulator [uncultured Novosphingobium sp.]|uniref:LysR family transcriptional regulator n=1 Tax=Novosphingobium clariflavum TaxID=2029884 RepID=A0ABV6S4J4_9SPHN|nr:LysR family transcriptional regulator [uncultured Novosphingobium sp.]